MAENVSMSSKELHQVAFLLGPWLIGSSLDLLMQGILFCQFTNYFMWHRRDALNLRIAVAVLALLTTLKSIQAFALVWALFIHHFTDIRGAILVNYTAWWATGNALMVASIGLYVQIFFCYRLQVISSKNYWFVAPIAIILLFGYISVCLATYYISQGVAAGRMVGLWFGAHLSAVFAGDMLITLATAYFLIKTRQEVLPQTAGTINALIRLTFQTAAPAAVCAMFNLIFSQAWSGNENLIAVSFNQILPKLYAVSMMWTLNVRHNMRLNRERMLSETSSGRRRENTNVELKPYNHSVRVHTQTEVTRHVDLQPDDDIKSRSEEFKMAV